tara:strand:+ start:599 stop:1432 length:834 start_codon:yes stop_codon:yes gene_type:complete
MPLRLTYYSELRLQKSPSDVTDEEVREHYVQRVKQIHSDLDLDMEQVKRSEEKAQRAFEMLQCASSRKYVSQVMREGKMECALPSPHPMTWDEAIFTHSLSFSQKAMQEWRGTWTSEQQSQHDTFMEKGGHLIRPRTPSSEEEFVQWVRYNCSFNAFAILGMKQVTLNPTDIEDASKNVQLKKWRDTTLGALSSQAMQDFDACASFATRCLLAPNAAEYLHALQRGYFEREESTILYRMPVTRTNIQTALNISDDTVQPPPSKKTKTKPNTPRGEKA